MSDQSLVTFPNVCPDVIRMGDTVTDSLGRTYVAQSDASEDQFGEFNVKTPSGHLYAYAATDRVTVTYDEAAYAESYA